MYSGLVYTQNFVYRLGFSNTLNLGRNVIDNEEIILTKFRSAGIWKHNKHHCLKVTSKVSPYLKLQTRLFWFDWNPISWKATNPLKNEDISWLKVYISSEDNAYGQSFLNRWHDGQILKMFVKPGEYKFITLKVV